MIINYPTGLYSLPKENQSGNVTYTISNTKPPRTDLQYYKLPNILSKQTVSLPLRNNFGQLAIITTTSSNTEVGSGAAQYEIGQVLHFNEQVVTPQLFNTPLSSELRHDLNELDFAALGVNDATKALINSKCKTRHEQVLKGLADARQDSINLSTKINKLQKLYNEIDRAMSAISKIDDLKSVVNEMILKKEDFRNQLDSAHVLFNDNNVVIDNLQRELDELSVVIK